jgi:hypothetical protein
MHQNSTRVAISFISSPPAAPQTLLEVCDRANRLNLMPNGGTDEERAAVNTLGFYLGNVLNMVCCKACVDGAACALP